MTRRAILRAGMYAGVLLASAAIVFFSLRGADDPGSATAGHDHSQVVATGATAQPVSLTAEAARRIGVTFTTATLAPLAREIRIVGQVTFDETQVQAISPKIDGWVERLYVNATGQAVSAGQPLLTIYSPMLVQAQEELLLARQLQTDVAGGGAEVRRNAQELLSSARRRLEYWDILPGEIAAIERSGAARKALTLRSRASGYVLEKNVLPGQRVMAGDALYRVADLRTLWVEGDVFEQDLATLRVGQVVHADFQALPDDHRMGRIGYIYPTVNPETRTARIRVILANSDLRLKPGMYATLRVDGRRATSVVSVPRDAVLSTGERHIVFVREAGGRLMPREVALGASGDERVEIRRGLLPGEMVVASATFLIDAESNLGKALGGMGDMPGMDLGTPPTPLPMQAPPPGPRAVPPAAARSPEDHSQHGGGR